MTDPTEQIRTFLARYIRDREFSDEDKIFEKGFVNSLFALKLVLFLESTFDVEVGDDDLDLKNFESVHAIGAFILAKSDTP
jgi:acyl carrier protein